MLHLIQCFQVLIRADCFVHNLKPHIWDLLHLFLSVHGHQGVLFPHSPVFSCVGLMAILIYPTVEGDSEEWFWAVARVQKVEQLNAALSLLLWLLHIQQVTHFFFFFSPNPTASRQLVFSGGGCGISGWGEENILFSLSWLVYLYREKVNLAQVMKEKKSVATPQ